MFLDVFRKGRHLGGDGRPVYPPMPWDFVRYRSDEDLKAIFAYLRSIPPLRNMPPTEKIPPPVEGVIIEMNKKIIALAGEPEREARKAPTSGPPPPPALTLKPVVTRARRRDGRIPAEMVRKGKSHRDGRLRATSATRRGSSTRDLRRSPRPTGRACSPAIPKGAPDPQGKAGPQDIAAHRARRSRASALPFGVAYAKNLTPDLETGIGKWTEEQFLAVFRKARHTDGSAHPPAHAVAGMIRHRSDADLQGRLRVPPVDPADPQHGRGVEGAPAGRADDREGERDRGQAAPVSVRPEPGGLTLLRPPGPAPARFRAAPRGRRRLRRACRP